MSTRNRVGLLVVDDRAEHIFVMEKLIGEYFPEIQVFSATSGADGLDLVAGNEIHGALIDVNMPEMNGIEMCRALRARESGERISVVLITSYMTSAQLRAQALDAGADDFIQRPIDNVELVARLKVMLRVRRAEDELRVMNQFLEAKVEEKAAALARSEARLQRILDNARDIIWRIDTNGTILFINKAAEGLLGYTPDKLLGRSMFRLMKENSAERLTQWISAAASSNCQNLHFLEELDYQRRDGTALPVELVCTVNGSGSVMTMEGIARDISERREYEKKRRAIEAQLRHQQRLESIGTLASGVAHEINNPITIALASAEMILDETSRRDEVSLNAENIVTACERMAGIVKNLLTFARSDMEQRATCSLSSLTDQTMTLVGRLLRKEGMILSCEVPEDLPLVLCNPSQIQQVIMNLLTNARDALNSRYPGSDPDKILRVEGRTVEDGQNTWVRLTVMDHGIGIEPTLLGRIFDPFFTTKPINHGTGLGLSVSHGIVREHGGRLLVESVPGEYTRFHLDLARA